MDKKGLFLFNVNLTPTQFIYIGDFLLKEREIEFILFGIVMGEVLLSSDIQYNGALR